MIILAVDTSTREGSVALSVNERLAGPVRFGVEDSHLVALGRSVDYLLGEEGVKIDEVDRIALVSGPGSFTGLRIGMAFVKGIHAALGTDVVTIPSLELIALPLLEDFRLVCPMIDARKNEVYAALYRPCKKSTETNLSMGRATEEKERDERSRSEKEQEATLEVVYPPRVMSPSAFIKALKHGPLQRDSSLEDEEPPESSVLFAGSGTVRYRELFVSTKGFKVLFADEEANTPSTLTLAGVANKLYPLRVEKILTLEPFYIRSSDAELKRLKPHRTHEKT